MSVMSAAIRVAVLDDHPLVLRSVRSIITASSEPITITHTHSSPTEFLALTTASPPDVAVVGGSGEAGDAGALELADEDVGVVA